MLFSGAAEAVEESQQRFQAKSLLQKFAQEMTQTEVKADRASWVAMGGRVCRFPLPFAVGHLCVTKMAQAPARVPAQ